MYPICSFHLSWNRQLKAANVNIFVRWFSCNLFAQTFFLNSCSTIWMYNSNGKSNFFQLIKHKDCWGEILCINKLWTFKSKYILSYLTSDNAWPTYPPSSDTIRWVLTYLPTLKSDAICGWPMAPYPKRWGNGLCNKWC